MAPDLLDLVLGTHLTASTQPPPPTIIIIIVIVIVIVIIISNHVIMMIKMANCYYCGSQGGAILLLGYRILHSFLIWLIGYMSF